MVVPLADQVAHVLRRRLVTGNAGKCTLASFSILLAIKGAFCGWNLGLEYEWLSMAIAMCMAGLMNFVVMYTFCEQACALPFSSGPIAYSLASLCSPILGVITNINYAISYYTMGATILYYIQDLCIDNSDDSSINSLAKLRYPILNGLYRAKSMDSESNTTFQKIIERYNMVGIGIVLGSVAIAVIAQIRPRALLRFSLAAAMFSAVVLFLYESSVLYCLLVISPQKIPGVNGFSNISSKAVPIGPASMFSMILCPNLKFNPNPEAQNTRMNTSEKEEPVIPVKSHEAAKKYETTLTSVFQLFPNAVWLFQGLEGFFLLAEEIPHMSSVAPSSTTAALLVIYGLSVTLVAVIPTINDEHIFAHMLNPLFVTLRCKPFLHRVLRYSILAPVLQASLCAIIYVGARLLYVLSRGAQLPTCLSTTTSHGAPMVAAAVAGATMGGLAIATVSMWPCGPTGPHFLLRISTTFLCLGHALNCVLYLLFEWRLRNLPRIFHSPPHIPGACIGFIVALGPGVLGAIYLEQNLMLCLLSVPTLLALGYWFFIANKEHCILLERLFLRNHINYLFGPKMLQNPQPVPALPSPPQPLASESVVGSALASELRTSIASIQNEAAGQSAQAADAVDTAAKKAKGQLFAAIGVVE